MNIENYEHKILIEYLNPVSKKTEKLDLKLIGRITIITGGSGTGKTYITESLANMKQSRNIKSNISLDDIIPITLKIEFTSEENVIDYLDSLSGKLIIIDEADSRLQDMMDVQHFIKQDTKNLYILMCRSLKIISENIATLEFDGTTFSLNYSYNTKN